jgi:zinc/manganese transport system substrate-binding protein
MHHLFFSILFSIVCLPGALFAAEAPKLKVVATFSIIGDMVHNVAGDEVELVVLVGPNADSHVYTPTPSDIKHVAAAGLVVANGLSFETWMPKLLRSAQYKGTVVEAARGTRPLTLKPAHEHGGHDHKHEHTTLDPHAWQSAANGVMYVQAIAAALSAADPQNAALYSANAKRYEQELTGMDGRLKRAFSALPAEARRVVTSHDAFGHFARDYGVEFIAPMGTTTGNEATAKSVASLIDQLRKGQIRAVFLENITDKRFIEQLSKEEGVWLGGTLFSDALSPAGGAADTYLKLLKNNADLILEGVSRNVGAAHRAP